MSFGKIFWNVRALLFSKTRFYSHYFKCTYFFKQILLRIDKYIMSITVCGIWKIGFILLSSLFWHMFVGSHLLFIIFRCSVKFPLCCLHSPIWREPLNSNQKHCTISGEQFQPVQPHVLLSWSVYSAICWTKGGNLLAADNGQKARYLTIEIHLFVSVFYLWLNGFSHLIKRNE